MLVLEEACKTIQSCPTEGKKVMNWEQYIFKQDVKPIIIELYLKAEKT